MSTARQDKAFPRLQGESLSRRPTSIPKDLEGDINLVMVAFRRRHQRHVDRWLEALGDIEGRVTGLAVYEIPVLARYPRLYRRWIDDGMRSGIPDPKTRARTITVYTHRVRFLDRVELPDDSQILVALLDGRGTMVWTHVGAPTRPAVDELLALLGDAQVGPLKDR